MYQQAACVTDWLEAIAEAETETTTNGTTEEMTAITEPEIAQEKLAEIETKTARVLSIAELRQKLNVEAPAAPMPARARRTMPIEEGGRPRIVRRREAALAAC